MEVFPTPQHTTQPSSQYFYLLPSYLPLHPNITLVIHLLSILQCWQRGYNPYVIIKRISMGTCVVLYISLRTLLWIYNMHNPIHAFVHLGLWLLPHNQPNNRIIQVHNYVLKTMIPINNKSWVRECLLTSLLIYNTLPLWTPIDIVDVTCPVPFPQYFTQSCH